MATVIAIDPWKAFCFSLAETSRKVGGHSSEQPKKRQEVRPSPTAEHRSHRIGHILAQERKRHGSFAISTSLSLFSLYCERGRRVEKGEIPDLF